jgi:hypothetical protein
MDITQIQYIDHLLPFYGCRGVEDYESVFNKTTIVDWAQLQNKLTADLPMIKNIFPSKSLNLTRLGETIATTQQAIALLRGLLKLAMIPFTVVRKKNSEFLRLNSKNNTLAYYIIHKTMAQPVIKQIKLNTNYSGVTMGIVKKFYVKFETVPETHKFSLVCGGELFCKTSKLIYQEHLQMWEIQFYSKIINLCDLPTEFTNCLFFNLLIHHEIMIYSKSQCQLYVETYNVTPLLDSLLTSNQHLSTFVEFAEPLFSIKSTILTTGYGMIGIHFTTSLAKYRAQDQPITDLFDGTHTHCQMYIPLIEKYKTVN